MKQIFKLKENIGEIGMFALPVFIEQLAISCMSVIFTIMVSHISTYAVSGFSLVESLNILIQQIFLSLEIGATVVIAQYCGRNDTKSASEACIQAMLTSVTLALILCAVLLIFPNLLLGMIFGNAEPEVINAGRTYFTYAVLSFPFLSVYAITTASIRGSGNPKLSLVNVVITNVTFAGLGLLFISGFKMGIAGAGLSILISRFIGAVTGIILLKKGNSVLTIERWIPRKIQWHIQKSILLIGIPACIENIIFLSGKLTTQTFIVKLGTDAMATNAMVSSLSGFYNIPGNTAAAITVPIVGKYIGMKNKQNAKDSSKIIILISFLSLTVLSVIFAIFAKPIAGLFTSTESIIRDVAFISRTNFAVSPLIWTISFVTPAVLRASGDMNYTAMVSIASMILFRMTIGYIFAISLGFGVIGIWIGMYIDWLVRGVLFGIRYLKGRWTDRIILQEKKPVIFNIDVPEI
ncbi:MAG: MATE family efflux transporter [Saccharofermentanales bacterium]